MTLFVEVHVIFDLPLAIFPWRTAGLDPFVLQGFPEPIGVIAAIREQEFGWRQGVDYQPGAVVIAHLPLRQAHEDRAALTVTNRMKFGVQPAFCPPDTAGNIPFLSRLAAVR